MMLLAAIIGVSAAAVLLSAGYLFGAKRSYQARVQLRLQSLQQAEELQHMREQLAEQPTDFEGLRRELQRMLEPVLQRAKEDEDLRATVQQVLTPLMQHERLGFELSHLQTGSGHHGDLTRLLNQIAEKGGFEAVLLSDEEGLPLAASSNAKDLDRLAAISSLSLLLADRIGRDSAPTPLSLMVHDEADKETLCRIFRVGTQRLLLTAVSTGAQLTPTSLDPALAKLGTALSS